ncbi:MULTISPECIES: chemotaxis protein CheW [unclassified Pseudomonas]|uniref:chemotaxis protein CheW n=1 Tax=unclassified Pseudomonas TaxID=196821 RepID=UPI002449A252|nr:MULTISPECIES: chemotaxis protein CheW [unclassified Pseudomonas]MDG9927281.1 chemotaxis protein CheW [Pseudomonas sp. GD04042]MDH0482350.1 chemotaxis protein CheW [Pseudomonas sp. GD04015]MDH0602703.1 chemotaxis protein CheW [Pseudomonas sp. GD03869]
MDRFFVLPFRLAGQHLAVPLDSVVRVIPALQCTPLPGAPRTVLGLANVRGQIIPVLDLARRFAWPAAPLALWQPFLWLRSRTRELLVPVEQVETAARCSVADLVEAAQPAVPTELLRGVLRTEEGLLLIQDVEQLLSDADEEDLQRALDASGAGHAPG